MVIHAAAGAGLTIIGYRILFKLVHEEVISTTPVIHTLFTAGVAFSILTLWEIYEFIIDQLGWAANKMQLSNFETMTDLIVGLIGIVFFCIPGYIILKNQGHEIERGTI